MRTVGKGDSSRHQKRFDGSQVDSTLQIAWRSQGHCHWKHNSSLRRQDFGETIHGRIEAEGAPVQYALSSRVGTDCVGHLLCAATDVNSGVTETLLMG